MNRLQISLVMLVASLTMLIAGTDANSRQLKLMAASLSLIRVMSVTVMQPRPVVNVLSIFRLRPR